MMPLVAAFAVHELKTWPGPFERVRTRSKRCEARRNDRGFKSGDYLHLREWSKESEGYTGRELLARITDVIEGGQHGIEPGYCVLSIVLPRWEEA